MSIDLDLVTSRPFRLPESPSRALCDAYVYLCDRPDVWKSWVEQASLNPAAPPSAICVLVRIHGTPIDGTHARAIGRIYAASMRKAA